MVLVQVENIIYASVCQCLIKATMRMQNQSTPAESSQSEDAKLISVFEFKFARQLPITIITRQCRPVWRSRAIESTMEQVIVESVTPFAFIEPIKCSTKEQWLADTNRYNMQHFCIKMSKNGNFFLELD